LFPYWFLFLLFATGALLETGSPGAPSDRGQRDPLIFFAGLIIAAMIGFRYEVGGDWGAYQHYFDFAALASLDQVLGLPDPAYQLLNWIPQQFGLGIWLTNLICGTIFTWGLVKLARTQPYPWLSMLVAIPYLVVVVAMGYSRQGVAIGILMLGIVNYQARQSVFRYALYVIVAALFHKTAVFGMLLVLFGSRRNRLTNFLMAIAAFALIYDLLLSSHINDLMQNYVTQNMSSQGAIIRVGMSIVPAMIFLLYQDRLNFNESEKNTWRNFSYVTFIFLAALFLSSGSTVIDRLALYVLPLQCVVLPRIGGSILPRGFSKLLLIVYSGAVLFIWLTYSDYQVYWVPYHLYPFGQVA
jgi:hypothetical protein